MQKIEFILAEKPSVAKDIAAALGGFSRSGNHFERPGCLVSAARGHLVEIGIPKEFDPGFNLSALPVLPSPFHLFSKHGCDETLSQIERLAKKADVLINACDAGREGELIFRLIIGYLGIKKPIERMWLQSMTQAGIKAAYASRRSDAQMKPLADAAISRSEADWLIGINATRALTKSNIVARDALVSAGRVQTPVLALVVDRENAITQFAPKLFWEIEATLSINTLGNQDKGVSQWVAKHHRKTSPSEEESSQQSQTRFMARDEAQEIVNICKGVKPSSTTDKVVPIKRNAPFPFDLTALQKVANTRFNFTAAKTLDIAQALYEKHKVTTYPRTASSHLPEDYPDKVRQILKSLPPRYKSLAEEALAQGYVSDKHAVFNNAKISDHFAIIPNGKIPEGLSEHELMIYDLITKRFLAAFFPPAKFNKTVRDTIISDLLFRATGSVLVDPGWLKVEGRSALTDEDAGGSKKGESTSSGDEEVNLPPLNGGTGTPSPIVKNEKVSLKEGTTKPPPRYSEATLLAAMEGAGKTIEDDDLRHLMQGTGLGTPATRAATIEELLSEKKSYLVRKGKQLAPTEKGIGLINALRKIDLSLLTSATLTGEWEKILSSIESGTSSRQEFMGLVRQNTQSMVQKIQQNAIR
jgi:DNA topoisomerase-3